MNIALFIIQRHVHARCSLSRRHGSDNYYSQPAQEEHECFTTVHKHPLLVLVNPPCFSSPRCWKHSCSEGCCSASCHLLLSCCSQLSFAEPFHFYPSSTRALRRPSASNVLLYVDTYFERSKNVPISNFSKIASLYM
jgi:hypothetical protein